MVLICIQHDFTIRDNYHTIHLKLMSGKHCIKGDFIHAHWAEFHLMITEDQSGHTLSCDDCKIICLFSYLQPLHIRFFRMLQNLRYRIILQFLLK